MEKNMKKQDNLDCFSDNDQLLNMIGTIVRENERIRMITGNDFSVFLPELINLDEMLASRVLGLLLDPGGAHGQGGFFLRAFLRLLPVPELASMLTSRGRVALEVPTRGEQRNRRIDILVECEGFSLAIENKLGAGLQKDQLTDYLVWLGRGHKPFYLVYLTPDGSEAPCWGLSEEAKKNYEGHYFPLAWSALLETLEGCISSLPPRIGYFVDDFCKAVKILKLGENKMSMNDGIVDYLANQTSDEQLKSSFAIYESYKDMSDKIMRGWLARLENALAGKVGGRMETSMKYDSVDCETDYLVIGYPDWKVSVQIMNLNYPHGGVPKNTILWGELIWTWEFGDKKGAMDDPWVRYLMENFEKKSLTGNMINVHPLGKPTDPCFLIKLRNPSQLFLFDELLETCRKIEESRGKFEKTGS